jgi:hypothetical protein
MGLKIDFNTLFKKEQKEIDALYKIQTDTQNSITLSTHRQKK